MNRSGIFTAFVILLVFLLTSIFLGTALVSAQDATAVFPTVEQADVTIEPFATPVPVPVIIVDDPTAPITPDEAANTLLTDIVTIIASWGAVVGVAGAILVGFAKYVPGLNQLPGGTLSIIVNGLLMVGYWIAQHFGLLQPYQLALGQVESVGTALLALVSAVLGSGLIHTQAARGKIPVVGYERTPAIK